jgi:hypothetical protein
VSAVEDALEALGHPEGTLPEPRLLADLFVRFQAQVPLRRAPKGSGADEALAGWLEDGSGCCGETRVRSFAALAVAAGFAVEDAGARRPSGARHRVLLAHGRRVLFDPAFPLPSPLSLDPPAEAESTGYGRLSVRDLGGERFEVLLETRGDERVLYRVEPGETLPGGDGEGAAVEAIGPAELFRLHDDRLLRWRSGVLEITDSWSRLRIPLPAADPEFGEALFGSRLPEPEPTEPAPASDPTPTLAVYHASSTGAAALRSFLADSVGHAALLPEGWCVKDVSVRPDGFDRTLVDAGAPLRAERVTLLPEGILVEAEGPLALFRTRTWRLEPRPGGTRMRLLATLRDPVPPRGLPEGTRRRLVFELASELLALDRLAAES